MSDTSVGYLHGDYPVAIDTTYIKRVQSVDLNRDLGKQTTWELGAASPAGIDDGPNSYTGSFRWFPIDLQVEQLLAGVASTVNVSFSEYASATAVTLQTLTQGISGARLTGVEYSCSAGGEYSANANFEGTGWDADGATTITAVAPSGVGAYRSPVVHVEMGEVAAARVQSFRLAAGSRSNKMFTLSQADPVGNVADRPEITLEVVWYESTAASGLAELSTATTCEIQIGSAWDVAGNIKHVCIGMQSAGEAARGSVQGWATVTHRFVSAGDSTHHGLESSIAT